MIEKYEKYWRIKINHEIEINYNGLFRSKIMKYRGVNLNTIYKLYFITYNEYNKRFIIMNRRFTVN